MMTNEHRSERLDAFIRLARQHVPADAATLQRVARAATQRGRVGQAARFWLSPVALGAAFACGALTMFLIQSGGAARRAPTPVDLVPVSFVLVADSARAVAVAGDFNDWTPERAQLQRRDGGVWSVILQLKPGRYNYAFLIDGRIWRPDPNAPPAADEDFGRPSSVMLVHRRL
jgi:hypothetical protein